MCENKRFCLAWRWVESILQLHGFAVIMKTSSIVIFIGSVVQMLSVLYDIDLSVSVPFLPQVQHTKTMKSIVFWTYC